MGDRKTKPERLSGHAGVSAPKSCATCGRTVTWRKKWERDWENVRFCSDACRAHRPGEQDAALEAAILKLLRERGTGKTICPSEAARFVAARGGPLSDDRDTWEPLMEPARAAARRLVAQGKIAITQGGVVVDPSTAKGAIRLRLV